MDISKLRDRIKELRRVPASALLPNPRNWRDHNDHQRHALRALLGEIGVVAACLARELPDGSLMLIDGHMRKEEVADGVLPVLVLDVTEAEADKIMATLDPLAAMAESNAAQLDLLLRNVETSNEWLQKMIAATAASAGLYQESITRIHAHDETVDEPLPSRVRMVQLFLDESNIDEFQDACTALAEAYGTANITDTVLEAVKRASASL